MPALGKDNLDLLSIQDARAIGVYGNAPILRPGDNASNHQ